MRVPALVTLFALVVSACGGETTAGTANTDTPVTTASSLAGPTTTAIDPVGTTIVADSPTTTISTPPPLVEIADGRVTGPEQIEVVVGETVEVLVVSDIDDEVHVHGYELVFALEAGVPLDLSFVADIPGVFEVEVHAGNTSVLQVRVEG